MKDVNELIYNELVAMRKDFKEYMEDMNKRVSILEAFKNKAVGILLVVGGIIGYAWEYIKVRIL